MPPATGKRAPLRAVIFDLDEALLVRGAAWRYAVEEAVAAVAGRRVDASGLVEEYRRRPVHHVLAILLSDQAELVQCERLCLEMFRRSGIKRLLVHEGLGMALDHLRAGRVEMGAVSREPHAVALKQVQSTGLDRFLAVLASTPEGEAWHVDERIGTCLRFLGAPPESCGFLSGEEEDLRVAVQMGLAAAVAGWTGTDSAIVPCLEAPADLGRWQEAGG